MPTRHKLLRLTSYCLLLASCGLVPTAHCSLPTASGDAGGLGEVTAVFFMPDGKTAIAACSDDKLHIFDVATGKERSAVNAHKDGVWAAALSPDGKYVATGGGESLVRLWDAATLKELRTFEGHTKEVLAVAFSPDSTTLASGGADHSIRTWDVATGKQKAVWHGHELRVLSVAFSPDDKTLASGGICTAAIPGFAQGATHADQVRLWDAATGKAIRVHGQRGTAVAFTPDGRALAAAGSCVTGIPYDGGTSVSRGTKAVLVSPAKDVEWVEMKNIGGTLALSPDGRLLALATGSQQNQGKTGGKFRFQSEIEHQRICLWETATGKEILQIPEEGATVVAFSPDGSKLAAGAASGQVLFFDLMPEKWPHAGKIPQLATTDLEKLWTDLGNEATVPAYQAIWTLSAAGKPAVAFLSARLQPEEKPAAAKVEDLLTKLNNDKYAVREAAVRDLKKLGPVIEPELRKAVVDAKSSPEVRKRVQQMLDTWEKRPASPEELRYVRALQVLERLATQDARAVVARLASGPPESWLTEQAALAVKRLERR